jgi:hypothetical protein
VKIGVKADSTNKYNYLFQLRFESKREHYINVNLSEIKSNVRPFKGKSELVCMEIKPDGIIELISDGECSLDSSFHNEKNIEKSKIRKHDFNNKLF